MPTATGVPTGRPISCAASAQSALTARRSRVDNALTYARKIILGQIAQTNLPEVAGIPALLMGQVGPFAGDGTHRTGQIAGGAPGQVIGKVEKWRACL